MAELDLVKLDDLVMLRKMTVTELAEKAGLSVPSTSKLLNGKTRPRRETVGKIAEALEVKPRELLKA